ncbi:conserved membrane hypothetical protein [Frankia sp. Hr75.2]|nr:conserved membrane hypothetical protein [Frankia sp. Hr75.2]
MNPATTTSVDSNVDADSRVAAASIAKLVTLIMATVVGLTFLFGFGNVLALGLRLGVPIWVAPLVAPAVDLSVVGLLLGTRHLALHGGPVDVLRSARRLLIFSSMVTLALNVAEPLIAADYGKAAFDAVGPLLLIGWSEVGPSMLQAMHQTGTSQKAALGQLGPPGIEGEMEPVSHSGALVPSAPRTLDLQEQTEFRPPGHRRRAAEQDLLHRARAEDTLHWETHHRPISAETLRKRLRIGAKTARKLVAQLRTDTRTQLAPVLGGEIPAVPNQPEERS